MIPVQEEKEDLARRLGRPPRMLGERNEFVLMVKTVANWPWLLGVYVLLGFYLVGMTDSLWDLSFMTSSETTARITGSDGTDFYVNDEMVSRVYFEYQLDGKPYEGYSYTTGSVPGVGRSMNIQYLSWRPQVSRLEGCTYSAFGLFGLIMIAVMCLPLFLIGIFSCKKRLGQRALMRNGQVGWAVLVEKESTNVSVNESPVYNLTFLLRNEGKEYKITRRTHITEHLEDEARELALFDPGRPEKAIFFDELPDGITVAHNGDWQLPSAGVSGSVIRLMLFLVPLAWLLYKLQLGLIG